MTDLTCIIIWMALLAFVVCFAVTLALANRAYLNGYDVIVVEQGVDVEPI